MHALATSESFIPSTWHRIKFICWRSGIGEKSIALSNSSGCWFAPETFGVVLVPSPARIGLSPA